MGNATLTTVADTTARKSPSDTTARVNQAPRVSARARGSPTVSHSDPLAKRTTISLKDLHAHPLVSLPRGTGMRTCIDEACAAAGLQPRIAFEASDPSVLAQLASRGLGVAILPQAAADAHPAELHAIAITRPQMRARLALAWRAQGPISPAARALITHARGTLTDPTAG